MLARPPLPLAWVMLAGSPARLLLAVLRVAFAVVLMHSQIGFRAGLIEGQTVLLNALDADLLMVSAARYRLSLDETFALAQLQRARGLPGVRSVAPLYLEDLAAQWRNPLTGREYQVRVIAFRPDDPVFADPDFAPQAALRGDRTVLLDREWRGFLGPPLAGTVGELNRRRATAVGTFALGPDFRYDGNLLVSDANLVLYCPHRRRDRPDLGLIRLTPGTDPAAACARLNRELGPDVEVVPRAAMVRREADYWLRYTPTGVIFGFGALIGFGVGVLACYQVLFNDIRTHLPQLATLKAVGYGDGYLVGLVAQKAVLLAVLGAPAGAALSIGLYAALRQMTGIPLEMTLGRALLVGGLALGMCVLSAVLAAREVLRADPADLFA